MTYSIPDVNFEAFEKKMQSLARKAKKMGLPFKYEVLGSEIRKVSIEEYQDAVPVKFIDVEVEFDLKIAGWKIVAVLQAATVDHNYVVSANTLHNSEDDLPEEYRSRKLVCEHCGRNRALKTAVVVHNIDTDEYKMVGTTCLQEYTGVLTPAMLTQFERLEETVEEYKKFSSYPISRWLDTLSFVKASTALIRTYGYISKDNASGVKQDDRDLGYLPTSVAAMNMVIEGDKICTEDVAKKYHSPELAEFAEKAIDYCKTLINSTSEFEYNIAVTAIMDYVESSKKGFAAYIAEMYRKHLNRVQTEERKKAANKATEYVGNIKDRCTFEITSASLKTSVPDNFGGYTYLYQFIDIEDHVLNWWTSKWFDIEKELPRIVSLTGTIKDHTEYNGIKQTVLTRCKCTLAEEKTHSAEPSSNAIGYAMNGLMNAWES